MRLAPELPFPPYTFVPGRAPHPRSDPAGHSFGVQPDAVEAIDPGAWQASRVYLHALDLFNAGYYWEAHEELERLWNAAGRSGTMADFLKGLIKLSAAGVKHLEGQPRGVHSHAVRAAEILRGVGGEGRFLGLALQDVVALAQHTADAGWPVSAPQLNPQG